MKEKKLVEKEIGDILYESPWLIDSVYQVANIKGQKDNGKEVDVGGSKRVDLLFKDTLTDRPVIVELKEGELKRKDVGQILEYRALWITLPEEKKGEFKHSIPKLVLIGEDSNEEVRLSANLAGIEVKELKREGKSLIDIEKTRKELSSYKEFLESETPSFHGRVDKIKKWYEILKKACEEVDNSLVVYGNIYGNIKAVKVTGGWLSGSDCVFPFMNFGVKTENEKWLSGFNEFYLYLEDKQWDRPYSSEHFYGDLYFAHFIKDKDNFEKAKEHVEKTLSKYKKDIELNGIPYNTLKGNSFITKIPRSYLNKDEELKKIFKWHIEIALYIMEKFKSKK